MTRGQRGRVWARLEFATAIAAIGAAAFVLVAVPGSTGPMFSARPALLGACMLVAGVGGVVIGLIWMVRIYRADPEPDPRAWRYRERN